MILLPFAKRSTLKVKEFAPKRDQILSFQSGAPFEKGDISLIKHDGL